MSDKQASSGGPLEARGRWPQYWKLYGTVLVIVIVTEIIGIIRFSLDRGTVVLLPMLFAVVIGILITPDVLGKPIKALRKLISMEEVEIAGPIVMIALLPLGVKYGTLVGPNVVKIISAGPAFLLQELGNLGYHPAGLSVAMLLGMKRSAIGATVSICREPSLGIIGERYGLDSPEGTGVLGTYMMGPFSEPSSSRLSAPSLLYRAASPRSCDGLRRRQCQYDDRRELGSGGGRTCHEGYNSGLRRNK